MGQVDTGTWQNKYTLQVAVRIGMCRVFTASFSVWSIDLF